MTYFLINSSIPHYFVDDFKINFICNKNKLEIKLGYLVFDHLKIFCQSKSTQSSSNSRVETSVRQQTANVYQATLSMCCELPTIY